MSAKESFKAAKRTAFILGYTGESGKALVQELAKDNIFDKIVLLGRRNVKLEIADNPIFEQKLIDFEKLDDYAGLFKDIEYGYSCLGTTRAKSGADGFRRVDYDYTLKAAQIAKEQGCKHFHLVSSVGADKSSLFLYPKTKGEVEDAITQLNFARLSIYRPAALLCERAERRLLEKVGLFVLKPLIKLFPTSVSVPTEVLARSMINNTVQTDNKPSVEILSNKDIHMLEKQPPPEVPPQHPEGGQQA